MIPPEDDALIRGLNEELLAAAAAEEKDSQNDQVNKARRNSKQDIINKILKTSEDFEITVEHSDTKPPFWSKIESFIVKQSINSNCIITGFEIHDKLSQSWE